MPFKLAFLHTGTIHVDRFNALVKKYGNGIETYHVVNELLLKKALTDGVLDANLFEHEIRKIRLWKPDMIVCTCSTLGELCDNFTDVQRIDEPIVRYLVNKYERILLVYAAASTKRISCDLLRNCAQKLNKTVQIITCDCTEAWKYFEQGNLALYTKTIAEKINVLINDVEAVFLAQASMESVADIFLHQAIEVFTSPDFGMKTYLKEFKN